MIPQQFIDEVQSRTDLVELISSYLPLRRTGRNFKTLCPFHTEKTPSFIVSPQKQIFHCFGCGEGGGVFQFLTLMEKITFPEAVEMLAKRLGLVIPYQSSKTAKTKAVLYEAMSEAALFFHNNLKNNKRCQGVRQYLAKRGIGPETIDTFCLGYAEGGDSLLKYMRKRGFTLDILEKVSLITGGQTGFYDAFRNRIMFPISDIRSRTVGFGARVYLKETSAPKYINSLENILYSKRNHLFGLNLSKDNITKQAMAIVVEGYLDMITPFMRGIGNIVASLGTALTPEQICLIKRYVPTVTIVYDSDKAGESATLRSIDLLLEHNLEVKVVQLPVGCDPDSLVRKKGKDYFLELLGRRQDFFEYKLDILSRIYDRKGIEGKSKIAQEMLATIDKLSSEIQKYEYIRKLALELGIKEEIMIAEFQKSFSKDNSTRKRFIGPSGISRGSSNIIQQEPLSVTEKIIFKFILTHPKAFSLIRKNAKEEYFSSQLARKTISFLFTAFPKVEEVLPLKFLRTIEDKEISSFISKILMDDDIPLDKNLFKESLLKLRKKGLVHFKKNLRDKIKEAEAKGDREKVKELINKYRKINSEVKNG